MRTALQEFSLPLAAPLETAAGTIEERRGFLVRAGKGIGEATPLAPWTEPLEDCRAALDRALDGLDPAEPDAALAGLEERPATRHAIELAIADHRAKQEGDPLYRHLGGSDAVDAVPVNATIGDRSTKATAEAAQSAIREGYGCLKIKVGAKGVEADAERLRAVRKAVGHEPTIRADANGAWSRSEAEQALEAFGPLRTEYVEQPLAPDDLRGHASLRGGPVDIALDESLAVHGVDAVVDAAAADVLIAKPTALGGPQRTREAAIDARRAGMGVVVTDMIGGVVARTAAVHTAASLPERPPSGLATADRLAADLGSDPAPVRDGRIAVPQAEGIGVELRGEWAV